MMMMVIIIMKVLMMMIFDEQNNAEEAEINHSSAAVPLYSPLHDISKGLIILCSFLHDRRNE
jgi:hypothetical protein